LPLFQVILGLSASLFNGDPLNALTIQQAILRIISNTQSVVILAVIDYSRGASGGNRLRAFDTGE
jgi:hypothetical protein